MRAVVQRVSQASVEVEGEQVGAIDIGLLVLVGVAGADQAQDAAVLADKVAALRIFRDEVGKLNRSVGEVKGSVLIVSQFTLHADVRRGRRPSFVAAAPPQIAEPLVEAVADRIRAAGIPVATGRFGATMEVGLVNDGPVTIVIEVRDGKVV